MRCYFFTNYYYSSIQQGIQPLHAAVSLFVKYQNRYEATSMVDMLFDWAENHQTVVCLNGGCNRDMQEIAKHLGDARCPYPRVGFWEEEDAIGAKVLTSIAIVLPEKIYKAGEYIRRRLAKFQPPQPPHFTEPRLVLADGITGDYGGAEECVEFCQKEGMTYSQWEIDFITNYLNACGLAS